MAFVNYNNKEITVKIVYYGPALSGKTTCLKFIYTSKKFEKKGKLITLDTDGDRTLFFDFLPIEIGKLGDYSIKMQLYTVPGQVAYDTTRKLVLQGADGVVFVADSQVVMSDQNLESFQNLQVNLELNNISFSEIPIIFQYNKRDLREVLPIEELNKDLNPENKPYFSTVATSGENILESLHAIMKMVIIYLKNRLTIFQKDKTVMFSRDEITARGAKKKGLQEGAREDDLFKEDTDKEEVVELSSPITGPEELEKEAGEEDEIFDLDDENILEDIEGDLDVPEVSYKDELEESDEGDSVRLTEAEKVSSDLEHIVQEEIEIDLAAGVKKFDIPVSIEIPGDKDELSVDLNLKIVIRKKKK